MPNICQNNEVIKNLAVWLCCGSNFSAVNIHLCQNCANYCILDSTIPHFVSFSQENDLHGQGNIKRLRKAYLSLLPSQKLVIYLKLFKRYSNQDVAHILSKSIGTVKAIQHQTMLILIHSVFSDC